MTFSEDLAAFVMKTHQQTQLVFVKTAEAVRDSVVFGSAITGAPGQPVGQYGPGYHPGKTGGTLRASWSLEFESPTVALIGSGGAAADYNAVIEYNTRGAELRSTVGGFHSVASTVAGFERLVEDVNASIAR